MSQAKDFLHFLKNRIETFNNQCMQLFQLIFRTLTIDLFLKALKILLRTVKNLTGDRTSYPLWKPHKYVSWSVAFALAQSRKYIHHK